MFQFSVLFYSILTNLFQAVCTVWDPALACPALPSALMPRHTDRACNESAGIHQEIKNCQTFLFCTKTDMPFITLC